MKFSVHNVKETRSCDIHLEGVSVADYNRILNFISDIEDSYNPIDPNKRDIILAALSGKQVSEQNDSSDNEWVPLTASEHPKPNYGGSNVIRRHQQAVKENPNAYAYEWMTAKEFMGTIPDLADHKVMAVAQILAATYPKQKVYNRDEQKYQQVYYVPIRKDEVHVAADNNTDGKRGSTLRRERLAHGLSVADLAKQIGYGVETILKWEIGEYHISRNAEECLRNVFCKDIFAEEEAAS